MKNPFSNLVPVLCVLALVVSSARGAVPVTTNASPEARALLNFLYATYGKKTLSGQMWTPEGADEIETVYKITGKYPAIRGQDYITEKYNARENELAIEWWKAGGIPTIMWHWGAPTNGEGYVESKMTNDIDRCFQPGTEEYKAMWSDLKRIADHLTVLRDAHVPVLWRPMHECDGGWFWYSKGGGEQFVRLWRTMFDYFTRERKLNNLIWVLCHSGQPRADFDPGPGYYDIAGGDTYGRGIQEGLWNRVKAIHTNAIPICYHECGTLPDPEQCFEKQVTWSWWMLWHTRYLLNHDKEALTRIYNDDLVLTRDELPNIMDYLNGEPAALKSAGKQPPAVPDWALPGSATHQQVPPPADFHRPTLNFATPLGAFEGQSDIGGPLLPGSAGCDAATKQYTLNSASYNIWYTRDEFRFLWKKMSGDVSLAADVTFPDPKGYGDRKAVLVIRQDLDDGSKEAMTALHGAGLIHLALRLEKNANIKEAFKIKPEGSHGGAPTRIGIEKHGDTFALYVSLQGEPMHPVGDIATLHLDGPFYVGIGFCSHVPDKSDTAVLSNVVIENSAGKIR
jgi:hypothetical protein